MVSEEVEGEGKGMMFLFLSGHELGCRLVSSYLFPASKMILESEEPRQPGIININPKYDAHGQEGPFSSL